MLIEKNTSETKINDTVFPLTKLEDSDSYQSRFIIKILINKIKEK